jgi:hypothetical protein
MGIGARLRRPGPRLARLALAVSVAMFVAMVAWSLDRQGGDLTVNVGLLAVIALIGTPLALALNGMELRLIGRAAGVELSAGEAATASLLASAANSLPLPGSVLVRGWSLANKGASLASIVRAQAVAGLAFIATGLAITGALVATSSTVVGLVLCGGGVAALAVVVTATRSSTRIDWSRLVAVEAIMVASELARISLVLSALGIEVTAARAAGLVGAAIVSTAVGIFPAGLGLREALAAVAANATSLSSAAAVTVAVADRLATSVVLGLALVIAVAAGVRVRPHRSDQEESS